MLNLRILLCKAKLLVPALAIAMMAGCASQKPAEGLQLDVGPLGTLDRLKEYETRRASSCKADWRNENGDSIPIAPGATAVLAELAGPGRIAHIWFTVSHVDPSYASKLTLRMYWDGEEHPSVECPLGDFFGVGMGLNRPFTALPVRVSSEGRARNCYWPMPFRKSARITVTNESEQPCRSFFYYVDWQKHASMPREVAYFHAMYRQEFPCVMGRNYSIADIQGRGHYVGTIQSVYHSSPAWYGEGDDFFFIDGAEEPQLRGTGTEDYFCDAWGFREQQGPFYGVTAWEGRMAGARGTAYRFHVPDPVTFRKALRVEIEHKGAPGFVERDDLMSSVAFWYQVEPHKPWPALPSGAERVPYTARPLVLGADVVQTAKHSEAPVQSQAVRRAQHKQLWFKPEAANGWLEIPFETRQPVVGDLALVMTHAPDSGVYRVLLDGQDVGVLDLYAPSATREEHTLGRQKLPAGQHALRFEAVGKNSASRGFFLGFDELSLRIPRYLKPE